MNATAILQSIKYLHPITTIEEIHSGLSHHCFKITKNTDVYFVKIYRNTSKALFAEQIKLEQYAGEQGISPKVINYCPSGQYCIYEYIFGNTLLDSNCNDDFKHTCLVDLLLTCHELQVKTQPLDIAKNINNLLKTVNLPNQVKFNITDSVNVCLNKLALSLNEFVLCHGDLNFSNVLLSNSKLVLLDWEYCCLAEREFDIAMCLAINDIAVEEYSTIVNDYNSKTQTTAVSLTKVTLYIELCNLLNTLWFMNANAKNTTANHFINNKIEQLLQLYR